MRERARCRGTLLLLRLLPRLFLCRHCTRGTPAYVRPGTRGGKPEAATFQCQAPTSMSGRGARSVSHRAPRASPPRTAIARTRHAGVAAEGMRGTEGGGAKGARGVLRLAAPSFSLPVSVSGSPMACIVCSHTQESPASAADSLHDPATDTRPSVSRTQSHRQT